MDGKCLCGGIEFEIKGEIPDLYQCHCSQCRKQGGSASNTATIVQEKQFYWNSGESLITQYKDKTGFNSNFCSVCGSPAPNKLGDNGLIWIPAGLLEDSENLEIVAHLYVGSRTSWETISNTGKQYDQMPGLEALIKVLQRTSR